MKGQLLILFLCVFFLHVKQTQAAKTTVNTLSTLTTVFTSAMPGDTIVVANGSYNWGKISLNNTNGNATSAFIVVMAQSRSNVIFTDSTYLMFSGYKIHIDGFKFANGNSRTNAVVSFRTTSNILAYYSRVSNITFDNYNSIDSVENEWVGLFGTNNRVDHCTFINKSNARATVVVWYSNANFPDRSVSTFHRIDSNYFKGRSYMGGNGGETIRVGVGNNSRTFGYNVIEYNLFEGLTQAEIEIVSNKSYYNTYRYNTFKNCNGGLTLRMGKYCTVYGNFFINDDPSKTGSYGIRIIDKGHKVYNNYCEGLLGASGSLTAIRCPIITYNGTYSSADSLNPLVLNGAYLPADSALIANNTIVNCSGGAGIKLGNYDAGLALNQPLGTTIANNVIKMSSGQAIYKEPSDTLLTYFAEGNMYSAPAGLGFTNTTGFANTTLSFGSRVNGVLPPPAVVQDASLNTANYLARIGNFDSQGQIRSSVFDAGCDEINGTGMVSNFPLDSNAVGAGKPIIILRSQTISFAAIPSKVVNATPDFSPGATSTSGLAITYTSSNPAVATIVNNNIHIVGYGTSIITANQSGNSVFSAAIPVAQTLTVTGISQSINFPAIPAKVVGDIDFAPGATASSGLAVTYTSSNVAVASIVNNNIHIVGAGTAVITVAQNGNTTYYAATSVAQTLTVTKTFTYVPTSTTILSGSINSGLFGNLATNNSSYYVVNSTTTGTRKIDWYGSVTITQPPSSISKLIVSYDGKNSASKTQILYLYNWVTAAWVQIDSRTVTTTDVLVTNTQNTPANYISSTGQIRLRVYSSAGTANYTCSGDWMQFQIVSTSNAKGVIEPAPANEREAFTIAPLIFPNPTARETTLKYSIVANSYVSMELFDLNGKKLKSIVNNKWYLKGDYSEKIICSGLPNGMYWLKIRAGKSADMLPIIVAGNNN